MDRDIIVVAVTVLMLGVGLPLAAPGGASQASDDRSSGEEKEFIVGFYELPDERDTYQGEPVTFVGEDLTYFVVETENDDRFKEQVRSDDRARYLEENHHDYELFFTPDDERYPDQYGPQITNTESAWDTTLGSTAVKLGYLDSGITADHEDFVNSRVEGYDYVNDDGTPEDASQCSYHGSHTAGTGAATTDNGVGIAGMSESTIDMHKIFDSGGFFGCGAASTSDIAQALKDHGDEGSHISSNSWGGTDDQTILDAIDYAHEKGVIHVAAAGNDGSCTDCISEPWASRPSKVVIVTCSDSNDDFCSFSSQGPEADLIAPGNNILSVDGGDLDGYQEMSGTSMSTPHVAGAVALYIDANGDVSHSTIEDELASSADDLGLLTERQGAGRLNSGALVGSGDGDTNSAPTAEFTSSCSDLNCTFDASNSTDSDGNITSYDWEFGDGTTGTGEIVNHTYDSGGDYTVNLTVTDDDGATDTTSQTISVSSSSDDSAGGIHSGDLDGSSSNQGSTWTATVTVLVHDENHTAEDGSTVTFDYDGRDVSGTVDCTSGTDGTCSVSVSGIPKRTGSVTFSITDITDSDGTYDSSSNHDPDGDSDGTTITVNKP